MKKISMKEAIDAARREWNGQPPAEPDNAHPDPAMTTDDDSERSTAMSPVFAAPYKGGAGLDFDDAIKSMVDAMPILSMIDSYLKPRPEGFLEVRDGAVGLVDKPTQFTVPTHDGSRHHYIENYGGTMEQGLKTRPLRTEDITTEMLDASPFLLRNMVEANGKTIKQNNTERTHTIPLDTLVELENGVRLFVYRHDRDCDGTPLYALSAEIREDHDTYGCMFLSCGHNEDCLDVVDPMEASA